MRGAIATADLIKGDSATDRLKRLLAMFKRYTGRDHDVNVPVFLSEKATGFRNRAMAYLMLNFGMVTKGAHRRNPGPVLSSSAPLWSTATDLAMMAATLANGGVNPVTGERALDERYVQDVVSGHADLRYVRGYFSGEVGFTGGFGHGGPTKLVWVAAAVDYVRSPQW